VLFRSTVKFALTVQM